MNFRPAQLRAAVFLAVLLAGALVCAPPAGARKVTDETGRQVQMTDAPQRIVSLAPGLTETLYALGLEDKIAGITTFCDWPQAVRGKTRIGGFTNPSIEKIVSLKPDLILATADGNRKETVVQLEKLGLPVYVTNPSDTEGVLKSIAHIGEITGREKAARTLTGSLRKRLQFVTEQTRSKRKPRVFFQIGLEPLITTGHSTLINEVIERAGGVNVAGADLANYPRYSAEGVIAAAPDIIVFAPMVNDQNSEAIKKYWLKYDEIPAVKNQKIYPVDANLINRASPRIVDAVETLAGIFHPEIKKK